MSSGTQQLHALTGLRGVLCLWVWFLHVAMLLWVVGARPFDDVVGSLLASVALHGYLAVDCFFILSGFVLCMRYQSEQRLFEAQFLREFWRARIARIYPLYLVTLLGMGIGVWLFSLGDVVHGFPPKYEKLSDYDPVSTSSFFANLFLVQSWDWFPRLTWNMAAWSISSEWAMYLLFPFLVMCTRKVKSMQLAFSVALILQILFLFILEQSQMAGIYIDALYQDVDASHAVMHDNAQRTSLGAIELGLVRAVVGFVCGCLLFQVYKHEQFKNMPIYKLALPSFIVIIAILLYVNVMYIYVWLVLFVLSLCDQRSMFARFLSRPTMLFLGNISYSVYLWHVPLLGFLLVWPGLGDFLGQTHWALLLFLIMTFTVSLLCISALSYWFIERPARAFIRGKPAQEND